MTIREEFFVSGAPRRGDFFGLCALPTPCRFPERCNGGGLLNVELTTTSRSATRTNMVVRTALRMGRIRARVSLPLPFSGHTKLGDRSARWQVCIYDCCQFCFLCLDKVRSRHTEMKVMFHREQVETLLQGALTHDFKISWKITIKPAKIVFKLAYLKLRTCGATGGRHWSIKKWEWTLKWRS